MNMKIKDMSGKKLPAITVFSLSIKALKDDLFKLIDTRGIDIKTHEIKWILTVPAIWSDSAKEFTRKAATKAGIPCEQLKLVLEPEAASVYCQHLSTDRTKDDPKGFTVSNPGTRYMVIDLGGGTVDITVHEKLDHNKLRELYKASGGACGGTAVDDKLLSIFTDIVGEAVMKEFEEDLEARMDLLRDLETVKRTLRPDQTGKVSITFPFHAFETACKEILGKSFKYCLQNSSFCGSISLIGHKLKVNVEIIHHLYDSVTDMIVSHIEDILEKSKVCNLSRFLLVGGFSESGKVRKAIECAFPGMKIITPKDAGLAVLKGAVMFGYLPDPITSRMIKYSYGVKTAPISETGKHDEGHKITCNAVTRCENVFSSFMTAGTSCQIHHLVVKKYRTNEEFQTVFPLEVFYSYKDEPGYTDESGVNMLGKMEVKIPNPSAEKKLIEVHFEFGDTELKAVAYDCEFSTSCECTFDLN